MIHYLPLIKTRQATITESADTSRMWFKKLVFLKMHSYVRMNEGCTMVGHQGFVFCEQTKSKMGTSS